MEGNKDEAEKCILYATRFLRAGNREKALKFVNKSIKLYSTEAAKVLLKEIHSSECNGTSSSHSTEYTKSRGVSDNEEEEINYTPEQIADVKRICACKDFYEVLGVEKDFTESHLKKAYRKLALQFHPDKNKAPGATDAFKRIGTAFAVLSDNDKRVKYDHYGENLGPSLSTRRHRREEFFEGEVSPEDLFNMFFGGGFPQGNVYTYRHRQHQQQQHQNVSSMYPIVQILPILLIVLFSMLSSLLISEPIYSFHQTSQYRYPFTTSRYAINYFMKDTSIRKNMNGRQVQDLEQKIEREYVETLQVRCHKEKQYRAELYYQARLWGSEEMRKRAQNYALDSCDRLQRLY